MFHEFLSHFRLLPPEQSARAMWQDETLLATDGYIELAGRFAGCSFENGLYRLHDASSGPQALVWTAAAFPEFAAQVHPFGYDWLGRQFALDTDQPAGREPQVLMLEPGSGEAFEIPASFVTFHNETLSEFRDHALAGALFDQWCEEHPSALPLAPGDCVGHRVPLFLGGSDTVDNLEVTDLDVHWSFCAQLRAATAGLPGGTVIGEVSGPS